MDDMNAAPVQVERAFYSLGSQDDCPRPYKGGMPER
jgi:hypothetical protein